MYMWRGEKGNENMIHSNLQDTSIPLLSLHGVSAGLTVDSA